MTEAEWLTTSEVETLWSSTPLSPRKERLLCVACCNCVRNFYTDQIVHVAIETAEQYADGNINEPHLLATRAAVYASLSPVVEEAARPDFGAQDAKNAVRIACEEWPNSLDCAEVVASAVWCREHDVQGGPADSPDGYKPFESATSVMREKLCQFLRDIGGNPFHPVTFDPAWRTSTVLALASQMYNTRDFTPMPILADALQDAGCEHEDILTHCRGPGPHIRGCWVVDLVLGKC